MSKVAALFLSFFVALGYLTVANSTLAKTTDQPIVVKDSLPAITVVEQIKPPTSTTLLESDKILRYQLRHRYTFNCNGVKYGVIDYNQQFNYTEITLLSGQKLKVGTSCSVKSGDPIHSIYIYQRE